MSASTIPDELNYETNPQTNIAIVRAMGQMRFMEKMQQLMPLVAQQLVAAGVDFSKATICKACGDTGTLIGAPNVGCASCKS